MPKTELGKGTAITCALMVLLFVFAGVMTVAVSVLVGTLFVSYILARFMKGAVRRLKNAT